MIYERLIRPLVFALSQDDPEHAHEAAIEILHRLDGNPLLLRLLREWQFSVPCLGQELMGLHFRGPVGLAAGFDKGALAPGSLTSLFDFVEGGAVLPRPQSGNPRQRIFRLAEEDSLVNRMGFNSDGVEAVKPRLVCARYAPYGINLGKMKETSDDEAVNDYREVLVELIDLGDFFVVNVSSPNTPGLRRLQNPAVLADILQALMKEIRARRRVSLLVKLSPDLDQGEYDEILEAIQAGADGAIFSNTSLQRPGISRDFTEAGGYSGPNLFPLALKMVERAAERLSDDKVIIGCGGINSGTRAFAMLRAGADLVQIYTSFIYGGPSIMPKMRQGIVREMEKRGLEGIRQINGRKLSAP